MAYQSRRQSKLESAERSPEELREYAQRMHRSSLRIGRMALAFAIVWPLLATLLFFMGSFKWYNLSFAYLTPMGMLGMMWIAGSVPRDGMWRMVRGTMVFGDPRRDDAEAQAWVAECFDVSRAHKFTDYCYIFRYKRDAALYKLMWG